MALLVGEMGDRYDCGLRSAGFVPQQVGDVERGPWAHDANAGEAASPFNAMLINLRILMEKEENIAVILPYLESTTRTTSDPEAQELIDKLDSRGNTPKTEED